ncbi:MAG: DUF1566 domain-containing protein, partial [Thermodesulfobacteriota bacterium]
MRTTGNGRIFMLLSMCVLAATLSGCADSGTTGGTSLSGKQLVLEDLGNGVCSYHPSGLMWQIEPSKKISTLKEALEYVNSLELAGFTDWRLPTRDECLNLAELIDMKKGNCSMKIDRAHWVQDRKNGKAGYWDDYPLCGGS